MTLERSDIQGLLFSAYAHLRFAAFIMLRIDDAVRARRWLAEQTAQVTDATAKRAHSSRNVAFTWPGLAALGLCDDGLSTFAFAFQAGMVDAHRSRVLGDVGANDPASWAWGHDEPVHVLLMLYAVDARSRDGLVDDAQSRYAAGGLREIGVLRCDVDEQRREHFGFRDGIGQPVIAGSGAERHQRRRTGHATTLPAGEFLLGHLNLFNATSAGPSVASIDDVQGVLRRRADGRADLGLNGSYLVVRQLEQDVPAFWNFIDEEAAALGLSGPDGRAWLAAKCIGRWPSGAPLALAPERDEPALADANAFRFADDARGLRCPIGAHVRRANPRDMNGSDPTSKLPLADLHRILRRGRPYGPRIADPRVPDGESRGLLFMGLNADLERQFELVQQSWINNPVFAGLSAEVDPLVGDRSRGNGTFTIPAEPIRRRVTGLRAFVRMRGGAYFFLPSLRALRYLAGLDGGQQGAARSARTAAAP